jgi:hypothetical protein
MENINRKRFLTNLGMMGTAIAVGPAVFANSAYAIKPGQSTDKKIRVGIIGCGSVSQYYMTHLFESPFAEIVSVCDIIPDLGVYNLTTLTGLLGPALSVTAMTNILTPTREIENKGTIEVEAEDNAHILLEHAGGTLSHIQCGFNYTMAHGYDSETISTLSVTGTQGRMDMIGYDWAPFAVDMVTARKSPETGSRIDLKSAFEYQVII